MTEILPAKIVALAHDKGKAAALNVEVRPMTVKGNGGQVFHVPEGICGFAAVKGIRKNSKVGKFLLETGLGKASEVEPGVYVPVSGYGQSLTRKEAYAAAFAQVLQEHGVKCRVYTYVD